MQPAALQPYYCKRASSAVTASMLEPTRSYDDFSFDAKAHHQPQEQLNQEHPQSFAPAWQPVHQPPTSSKPATAPSLFNRPSIDSQFDVRRKTSEAANRSSSTDNHRASNPPVEVEIHLLQQQHQPPLLFLQTELETRSDRTNTDLTLNQKLNQTASSISTNPFLSADNSLPLCAPALITQKLCANKNDGHLSDNLTLTTNGDVNLLNQKPKDQFNFLTCIPHQASHHNQSNLFLRNSLSVSVQPFSHLFNSNTVNEKPSQCSAKPSFLNTAGHSSHSKNSYSLFQSDKGSSFRESAFHESSFGFSTNFLNSKAVCDQPRSYPTANWLTSLTTESPTQSLPISPSNKQISVVRIGCCSSSVVVCNGRPTHPSFSNTRACLQQQLNQNLKDKSFGYQQQKPVFVSTVSLSYDPQDGSFGLKSDDLAAADHISNKMFDTETLNNGCNVSCRSGTPSQHSLSDNAAVTETLQVFRDPGERLGMALKFEGGSCASERIERVFIQNVADHSPASRVRSDRLDQLRENDELLEINGRAVQCMSRLQCVACLKDASTCIQLTVRRQQRQNSSTNGSPFFGKNTSAPLISFAPVKPATLIKSQPPSSIFSSQNQQLLSPVNQSMPPIVHGQPSGSNMSRISGLGSATDISIENGMQTIRRFKGPPPCIPPRLSTTVLTSRPSAEPPTDPPPSLQQKLFFDDLEIDQSTNHTKTICPSDFTERSSIILVQSQSTQKPPNVPRRPSQPPPLPPRKVEPSRVTLELSNRSLPNQTDKNDFTKSSFKSNELPLIGKSDTQVEAVHTQHCTALWPSFSSSNLDKFVSDSSNQKENFSEHEGATLQPAFNSTPPQIQSATNLPISALQLLYACSPAENYMDSLNSISVSNFNVALSWHSSNKQITYLLVKRHLWEKTI